MRIFSASEAAKTTGAELLGDPGTAFSGVSYDSRSVLEGSLFVAVKGEKADGADYIEASFAGVPQSPSLRGAWNRRRAGRFFWQSLQRRQCGFWRSRQGGTSKAP